MLRQLYYKYIYKEKKKVNWNIQSINFNELDKVNENYINEIYKGTIECVVIKNVIDPQSFRISKMIPDESKGIIVEDVDFGTVIGKSFDGCSLDEILPVYYEESPAMKEYYQEIFSMDIISRIKKIIEKISNNKVVTPKHLDYNFKPSTLRIVKSGYNGMRPHIGNEFITFKPEEAHIRDLIDMNVRFSYFILLRKPTKGGELMLYDLVWKNTPKDILENRGVELKMRERSNLLEKVLKKEIEMEEGDMLIFDGGRIWHEVVNVKGDKNRITFGGFLAYTKSHKNIIIWA